MFLQKGAQITVCDRRSREQLGELADRFEAMGVTLCLGDGYLDHLDADVLFRTPGMRYYLPELNRAREQGIAVTSELEIFFEFCPCPIYAVTGSDGKTTTTTVISKMLQAQGKVLHLFL